MTLSELIVAFIDRLDRLFGVPTKPDPIVDYEYVVTPAPVSEDERDQELFMENVLAFWLDPRRWEDVDPNAEMFWEKERAPYIAKKSFTNQPAFSSVTIVPKHALQIDRERAYIKEWSAQWK